MTGLFFLLLFNAINVAKLDCSFSESGCNCENIELEDFLDEFYKNWPVDGNYVPNFSLTIRQSVFRNIIYLPKVPADVQELRIEDSFVTNVDQNAFKGYQNLNQLSLSGNNLTNISFVINLPQILTTLDLSNNNISHLEDVFQTLTRLQHLDLSYNRIDVLNLATIFRLTNVNLFANRITNIIPYNNLCLTRSINLGRNLIKSFNETFLGCSFDIRLDLSYNKLTMLETKGFNSNCDLTGNNVEIIQSSNSQAAFFFSLYLSNISNLTGLNRKIVINAEFKMIDSKIPRLSNDVFDVGSLFNEYSYNSKEIDLSNCSISEITEYYFKNIQLPLLKLTFNNISELGNNLFYRSSFKTLNLSFSQIQSIKSMAFSSSRITVLDLSHNEINNTKNIFNDTEIEEINLSFNKIQFIFSNSFENVKGLKKLKLAHCLIQIIEDGAFSNLNLLHDLDISYNRMFILEANNFSNMPIRSLNLDGNFITAVMSKAFNNLSEIVQINLFNKGIKIIEANAFYNLPSVKTIDLRNNSINKIPANLFFQTENLERVLLTGNNITDINLSSHEIEMECLNITFNGILEPKNLSNVNIKSLVIQNSQLEVLKANTFDGLYNLKELIFTRSNIYSIEPGALNHLYRLKYLDTKNLFKFTKNITIKSFQDIKSLQILNLSSLSLESLESYCFIGLVSLETLLVNDNDLVELENFTFYGLKSLNFLDLSQNKIKTISDQAFSGLDKLEEIRLNGNRLTYFEVHLPTLKSLHLENNNINGRIYLPLGQLEELYLEYNSLSKIPAGIFQNLTNLKVLNLSHIIRLDVEIGGLTNLKKLQQLDLSHNHPYNGYDINIFFSLDSLTHMYLDDNGYTFLDIKSLANRLRELKYVGISQNEWRCYNLGLLIDDFNKLSISYQPILPYYDGTNINGIHCT